MSLVHDGPLVIIGPHVFLSVSSFNLSKVFGFVCQMFARGSGWFAFYGLIDTFTLYFGRYVKKCYLCPKSIALDGAKILCKPIVVTDFSMVHDQFSDGVNASIGEMNGTDVGDAILNHVHNPEIAQRYASNLSQCDFSNIKELDKFITLL